MSTSSDPEAGSTNDGSSPERQLATRLIAGGAVAACVGVLMSLADLTTLSAWLTVAGTVVMMWGLHRYGRGGPA